MMMMMENRGIRRLDATSSHLVKMNALVVCWDGIQQNGAEKIVLPKRGKSKAT
jgi:hypothetical protein